MNCKTHHNICKACCCGPVPIQREIFAGNFEKQVVPVVELFELGEKVLLLTATGKCTFLNDDYSCNIYEHRPDICRKFGDETHINMTCAFQDKNGIGRTLKETKKIEQLQHEKYKSML